MRKKGVVNLWGATNSRGKLVKSTISTNRADAANWAVILDGRRVRVEAKVVRPK